jgi:hypothetical protein
MEWWSDMIEFAQSSNELFRFFEGEVLFYQEAIWRLDFSWLINRMTKCC